jgi:hypothetical protein
MVRVLFGKHGLSEVPMKRYVLPAAAIFAINKAQADECPSL